MLHATATGSEEIVPLIGKLSQSNLIRCLRHSPQGQRRFLSNFSLSRAGICSEQLRYKYPVAVGFILVTKLFEAFAANGIRTILALYLYDALNFSESFCITMLHVFNFFGQFMPIVGAVVADSYIGNVRTISSFCYLYAFGWIFLIMTSLPDVGMSMVFLISISLLLIAVGNGSIRACITSLGAMQFKLPDEAKQLTEYFSFYYFVYYFGIFVSKLLPPFVRVNTQCFDKNECYLAVFGTLGSAFMTSWITFSLGKFFYEKEKLTDDNILLKFYGCIKCALMLKWRSRRKAIKLDTPGYWLHYANGYYDEQFIHEVSRVLRLLKLFIPLPIYFALLAQQDSSWTFQASKMNTTVIGISVQPDQAKAMGPMLLFIFIPLWQYACVPVLKCLCRYELKPLHSVTAGGFFSAVSFLCAGALQEYINLAPQKSVNIVWQVPQFTFIMLGELLLSIPGLQFAFIQAPQSMKSVVTAAWFMNNAFGNLLVVLITQFNIFSSQTAEYFFYAVLMLVCIIIFTLLAFNYALYEHNTTGSLSLCNEERTALIVRNNNIDNIPSTSRNVNIF